jgi:hypothetical protein
MSDIGKNFSLNNLIDLIEPGHVSLVFMIFSIMAVLLSIAILFHFNKYRHHSLWTIIAELIYLVGIILLFGLAFIFLVLFSRQ